MSSAEGNGGKQGKRKQRNSENTTYVDAENSNFLNCGWQNLEMSMTDFRIPSTGKSSQTKAT